MTHRVWMTPLVVALASVPAAAADLPHGALYRLGDNRLFLNSTVVSAGFTGDGKTLLAATQNGQIVRWDMATGKELGRVEVAHANGRNTIFSADGSRAVSAEYSNTIRVLECATGKILHTFADQRHGMTNLAWLTANQTVVSAGDDGNLHVWDVPAGRELSRWEAGVSAASSVASPADGKTVAATTRDGAVKLWDATTGKEIRVLPRPAWRMLPHSTGNLSFSPDGKRLTLATQDRRLPVWDVAGGELKYIGSDQNQILAVAVAFAPDGKRVAVTASHGVRVYDVESGKVAVAFAGRELATAVAFSPDGKAVAAVGQAASVKLWDAADGRPMHAGSGGHRSAIRDFVFLDGGKTVASHGADEQVLVWDLKTGRELSRLPDQPSPVNTLAATADGKSIVFTNYNFSMHFWTPGKAVESRPFKVAFGGGEGCFSPDGRYLAIRRNVTVDLFDTDTGKDVRTLAGFDGYPQFPRFSADGRFLAVSLGSSVRLWETDTGRPLRTLRATANHAMTATHVVVDSRGRWVATAGFDGAARVWEVASGRVRADLPVPQERNVSALAVSADGRLVATATNRGTLLVNDLARGNVGSSRPGHTGGVTALAFSPDGTRLITGGMDGTVVVWDVAAVRPTLLALSAEKTDFSGWWDALAAGNAVTAHRAIWTLTLDPKPALALIRDGLKANQKVDSAKIAEWISDLDAEKFAVREKASKALARVGDAAVPALEKALADNPSAEARRRIGFLLAAIGEGVASPRLRLLRALEVLEKIGGPEARGLVEELARISDDDGVTVEAKAALRRWRREEK